MVIEIAFARQFKHEVRISATYKEGAMVYLARLEETGFLSHFDFRKDHTGETIEQALASIAAGVDEALTLMHAE